MFGALCEGLRATPKFGCSKPELGIFLHGPGSPPCNKMQVALLNPYLQWARITPLHQCASGSAQPLATTPQTCLYMVPKALSIYGPKGSVYIWSQRLCLYMVPKALSIYAPKGAVYIWSQRVCLYTLRLCLYMVPKTLSIYGPKGIVYI